MKIIDAHSHIFPEKLVEAAVRATASFYATGRTPIKVDVASMLHHVGTVEDLLQTMAAAGVTNSVVFAAATSARQVQFINDFIAQTCAQHPELYGVGTMHIDYPDFDAECARMSSLGLRGIKLHPDIQRFRVDDERLWPLYEALAARHMFLITHAGDNRYDYSGPARLAGLAKRFPQLHIVCAHFAGWSQWDEARELLRLDNIYMDTSSTIGFAGPETAKKAFQAFDPTHIFFGTDYPMWDQKEELDSILALGLDDATLEGVLHGNFERFLAEL